MGKLVFGLLLVGIVAVAFFVVRGNFSEGSDSLIPAASAAELSTPGLPANATPDQRENWFWQIIEMSRRGATSQDAQTLNLARILESYPADDVEIFSAEYDRVRDGSYSWDLWGAAYIIMGGCSDDCFDYFRSWLISNGREFFEAAGADPDSLTDLISPSATDSPEFEALDYVAGYVWASKTQKAFTEMPRQPTQAYVDGPKGEPFEETEEALTSRFPKLWERFGHEPLGGW